MSCFDFLALASRELELLSSVLATDCENADLLLGMFNRREAVPPPVDAVGLLLMDLDFGQDSAVTSGMLRKAAQPLLAVSKPEHKTPVDYPLRR